MRTKHFVLLVLLGFFLLSPVISFSLKTAFAQDSSFVTDTGSTADFDSTTDTGSTADFDSTLLPVDRPIVYTLIIDGAIGTVTNDRIELAIELADENDAELLVIFLDTPGGFTKPTWSICKAILNSPVPVCIYIAPPGARAGSAGVYMTYSAHFAAMAPSTNIGAAHPVAGGGQKPDSVMNEKITNDAVAQIRAAAERRGRNAEWAEQAVRESTTRELGISWIHTILELITQPDIAFILFSIGSLGILLELYNPGAILPGVVGTISLVLAFYAFQALPINYAGLALILLAIIMFIAEIKIISHGLLTIGGLISFFFGGLMLIDTVDPSLQVSKTILITVIVCVGAAVVLATYLVVKAARHTPFIGREGMVGKTAEVRSDGFVHVDGALWKATSEEALATGDQVEIVAVNKLILKVKKLTRREGM